MSIGREMGETLTQTGLTQRDEQLFKEMGYMFYRQIGSGSYAKVFLTEKGSGRESVQYACKIIDSTEAPKEFTKKFLPRELEILSKVKHPNIIYIQGIYQRNGRFFIFMQNAEEGDLLEYILKDHSINEVMAKVWSHQMLAALQYLHAYRIAHRDIKCENILITRRLNAKLADFGFAKVIPTPKSLSKTYCGSVAYAAPEVMKGKPYAPMMADIWSLGVVIYVILNRALPFPLDKYTPKLIYVMQMAKQWKFRTKTLKLYSHESREVVEQMLEPQVQRRPKAEALLLSKWFIMSEKGTTDVADLTKQERMALQTATTAKAPVLNAVLNTTTFDLLEVKTEQVPSENIIGVRPRVEAIPASRLREENEEPAAPPVRVVDNLAMRSKEIITESNYLAVLLLFRNLFGFTMRTMY